MNMKLFAAAVSATLSFSEAGAREFVVPVQDLDSRPAETPFYPSLDPVPYAQGLSAQELFNESTAEAETSHGGGIRVESKQVSEFVECYKVTDIERTEAGGFTYTNPYYACDYFGASLGS